MCDPVTAVVGQAVLNIMEKEQCQLNALTMGRLLVDRLTQLQRIHPNIGERKYNFKILIRINYLKMLFKIIYFTILVRKNTSKYWWEARFSSIIFKLNYQKIDFRIKIKFWNNCIADMESLSVWKYEIFVLFLRSGTRNRSDGRRGYSLVSGI